MIYAPSLPERGTFVAWRNVARLLMSHHVPPDDIDWSGRPGLFTPRAIPEAVGPHNVNVTKNFLKLSESVVWNSDPERFAFLYKALWRLRLRDGDPLSQSDVLGRRLHLLAKSVGRDIHKMHAFVRFHELPSPGRRRFAAWFEPEHYILEPGSHFFMKRFADMDWMIATPRLTARFEGGVISYHTGGRKPPLPADASEELWATYFANIFNPARIKMNAMRSEMPKKYWKNLPETRLIPSMLAEAEERVARMREAGASASRPGAAIISTRYRNSMEKIEENPKNLKDAKRSSRQCRRCSLCEMATQTVWGVGPENASLMIVTDQPGDREDLTGELLDGEFGAALRELTTGAGFDFSEIYVTTAVKHFKFRPEDGRRIPLAPDRAEIEHCLWWLDMELAFVRPRLVLALGTAPVIALISDGNALELRRGAFETGRHGGRVMIAGAFSGKRDRAAKTRNGAFEVEAVNEFSRAFQYLKTHV
ncbi:uracil-DNA glycosylase [Acetobacter nitrogenifigens DSM 23921 = NBRC 105050]|uniref:Uracil-DNA glycosylase n=1 Tax=Acetobacter nitrogenifigens DSM 23921 = NBRC 105050 TaxID=1120919 RepID=A0A511XDM2_9PROT|nr:uracil-DNA glycosylase [Acetobacter nitrogenifigens DSM 23921 = NBRC 105050]